MGPRPKSMELRSDIRRLLRAKHGYDEVKRELRLSRSTFFRHLAAIRAEDREWLEEMARNDFLSSYRNSVELMEDQIRALVEIREQAVRPHDKIEATQLICEIQGEVMNLLAYGPTLVLADKQVRQPGATLQPDGNPFGFLLPKKE